jgi:hypothetical protein
MDYENMTDPALFEELRDKFPRATLKRITMNNRPIVVQLLKAYEEKKRRDQECTARRSEKI